MQQFDDCEDPGTAPFIVNFTVASITLDSGIIPNLGNEVIINGPIVLDGDGQNRFILDLAASADVTVNLATFQNNGNSAINVRDSSSLTVNGCVFDDNQASNGGAVNAGGSGVVRINGSSFTRNEAIANGGAINKGVGAELFVSATNFGGPLVGNSADRGGAIYIAGVANLEGVVLTGVSFLGNESTGTDTGDGGGALYIQGADSSAFISIFGGAFGSSVPSTGNTAARRGGAIYNNAVAGLVNTDPTDILSAGIVGVEFIGNTAEGPAGADGLGGAIYNQGSMDIYHATFEGNSSASSGGGAIGDNQMVSGRELVISNSTFTGNDAATDGGAISMFNGAGEATLRNVTLSGNTATGSGREIFADGDVDLGNVILANASAGANCAGGGTYSDSNGNLLFDVGSTASCGLTAGPDPLLDSLTLNPGPIPVRTMALMAGSPALGAGDSGLCSSLPVFMLDARGVPRPSVCDSGAFEGGDTARIVINEVDYDQGATDDHEFIELFNAGSEPIDLDNFVVELIDGSSGGATAYATIDTLTGSLAAGDFYVLCGQTGAGIPPTHCDLDLPTDTDLLQDGDPDAIGLRLSGLLVDSLSYGGDSGAPYTETAGAGDDDPNEAFFGLSREPDGVDTDDNSVDFLGRCATPSRPNVTASSNCMMVMLEPGELQFTLMAYSNPESGMATISVERVNGADGPVTVQYATSDGTATSPADYTAASGMLMWADGDTADKTFDVAIAADLLDELDETVDLTLSSPTGGAVLGSPSTAVLTISDDDSPPQISIGDVAQVEGNAATSAFSFAVTLDNPSGLQVTVDFATADGSATLADTDYQMASGTLTFMPSETMMMVDVQVEGDTAVEADENFFVDLSVPSNATILDSQGEGTILDDDSTPDFSVDDPSVVEGDAGTTTLTFTVSLSQMVAAPTSVDVTTADGTAVQPADYVAIATTTVVFPANSVSQPVVVTVNSDLLDEDDETLFLDLTNPQGGTGIADSQGVGTIQDNDSEPLIDIDDVSLVEGNVGTTSFDFTVSLSAVSGKTVTVDYMTSDGAATVGDNDYQAASGTLTFMPGDMGQVVSVSVNGDPVSEPNEDFFVNLSNGMNGMIGDGQGVGTIQDDDSGPVFSIDDVTVAEGDAGGVNATFTVTLMPAAAGPTSIDVMTSDGTATAVSDYGTVNTTLNFATGVTSQPLVVVVNGDTTDEVDETYFVDLTNPIGGATISDAQGLGTITDDDPLPSASIQDVSQVEGNAGTSTFDFAVTLSEASGKTITVDYATADGSATTANLDYVSAMGTLTFLAGDVVGNVSVSVNGDVVIEPSETFLVNLSMPVEVTLADSQAVGTIVDDDGMPQAFIDDITLAEGDAGATDAVFSVSLSMAALVVVSLDFATADGTAVDGSDYQGSSGTADFPAGVTSVQIVVPVLGDTVDEFDETFFVDLTNPVGIGIADNQGQGTITDDDPLPDLEVPPFSQAEGDAGMVTFDIPVVLSPPCGKTVMVDWTTVDGTATAAGADYLPAGGTLTFAPGEVQRLASVAVLGDVDPEGTETFSIELSNPVEAQVVVGTDQVSILGDDGAAVIEIPTLSGWSLLLLMASLALFGADRLRRP
jgi:hypothetical protein